MCDGICIMGSDYTGNTHKTPSQFDIKHTQSYDTDFYGKNMTSQQSLQRFLLVALPVTFIWLAYNALNHRPLGFDEAQYWVWSQHLTWGYHSKPPMIAGMIRLTTKLFGHSEFAARLSVPLCNFFTALLVYQMARLSYGQHTALWSGVSFLCLPIVILSSSLITVDPFMMLFWALALYGIIRFMHTGQAINWLLVGAGVGLSIMSKYTGLFFLLSLLLCIIGVPACRAWYKKWYFYAALVLALLIFLPNIVWNVQHGLQTFKHVAYHNENYGHWQIKPLHILSYIGQQFGAFSPILFPAFIIVIFQAKHTCTSTDDAIYCMFSLPILIALLCQSFMAKTDTNWTAPAYIAATPWVINTLRHWHQQRWLKLNLVLSAVITLLLYSGELSAVYLHNTHIKYIHPYRKIMAWQKIKSPLRQFTARHPHACYLFDSRKIWSRGTYYGQLPTKQVYFWKADNNYDIDVVAQWSTQPTCQFFYVGNTLSSNIRTHFSMAKPVTSMNGTIDPRYPYKLTIYKLGRLIKTPFNH